MKYELKRSAMFHKLQEQLIHKPVPVYQGKSRHDNDGAIQGRGRRYNPVSDESYGYTKFQNPNSRRVYNKP